MRKLILVASLLALSACADNSCGGGYQRCDEELSASEYDILRAKIEENPEVQGMVDDMAQDGIITYAEEDEIVLKVSGLAVKRSKEWLRPQTEAKKVKASKPRS
jgi:hypothetical protein